MTRSASQQHFDTILISTTTTENSFQLVHHTMGLKLPNDVKTFKFPGRLSCSE